MVEFSLGAASVGDTTGIVLSNIFGIFLQVSALDAGRGSVFAIAELLPHPNPERSCPIIGVPVPG